MTLSQYIANKLNDHIDGVSTFTAPAGRYLTVATGFGGILAASAAAAATTLSLSYNPGTGSFTLDPSVSATMETVSISGVTGAGPYTATLSTPTKFAHAANSQIVPATLTDSAIAAAEAAVTRQSVSYAASASRIAASSATVTISNMPGVAQYAPLLLAIYDASTVGNLLRYSWRSDTGAITAGGAYQIPSGSLTHTLN